MKIAFILIAVAIVAVVVFAICSQRNSNNPAVNHIVVSLPAGWHEEPGASPRSYRRDGENSGFLKISLQPPPDHRIKTGVEAETLLTELLNGLGMDLGERKLLSHGDCAAGIMAFAVHKVPKVGLAQFWVIPGKVTIFATYEMGGLETVKQEMQEAHNIMKGVKIEKGKALLK